MKNKTIYYMNENIIFSKKSDADLKLVTIINDTPIVQILLDNCLGYIEPDEPYIGIIIKDKFHVFNLNDDSDEFPEYLRTELENKAKDIEVLIEATKFISWQNSLKTTEIKNELNKISDFEYIISPNCPYLINLLPAKKVIEELNKKLDCHLFRISIDYVFELESESTTPIKPNNTTLLLCLFREKKCVSSVIVTLKTNNDIKELEIDSNTEKLYEGRKFNKLLRSVIIIIAKKLNNEIEYVSSNAVNPISLYLMIKYFNAIPYSSTDNTEIKGLNTQEEVQNYISKEGGAFPKVILDEKNIKKAEEVFNTIVTKEFECKKGGKRKTRNKKNKKTKKISRKIRRKSNRYKNR